MVWEHGMESSSWNWLAGELWSSDWKHGLRTTFQRWKTIAVLVFYCCYKDHDLKQHGEKRVYFLLNFQVTAYHRGQDRNSSRDLEAGNDAETIEEGCLLSCSAWFLIPSRTMDRVMASTTYFELLDCSSELHSFTTSSCNSWLFLRDAVGSLG